MKSLGRGVTSLVSRNSVCGTQHITGVQTPQMQLDPKMSSLPYDLLSVSAVELQKLFKAGRSDSVSATSAALKQIDTHNHAGLGLRALISVAPRDIVLERARKLDEELHAGNSRGVLHGVPVIVKDSIATHPELGMKTTAGSWALANSEPEKHADVVEKLLDAGAIIIGKSSLTEFNNWKAPGIKDGWSPVGGQTSSVYVRGGVKPEDKPMGHSTPGGSSSGSAVGVAAGFGIVSLGVETDGSVLSPASRSALYAIKPTIHAISMAGVVPVALSLDSVGPMARTPSDLLAVTTLLMNRSLPGADECLDWHNFRIGFLDESIWRLPDSLCETDENVHAEMDTNYRSLMNRLGELGAHVEYPVSLTKPEVVWPGLSDLMVYEFRVGIEQYLKHLKSSEVRSLEELVQWNTMHADIELPPEYPSQQNLESSLQSRLQQDTIDNTLKSLRKLAGPDGVDKVLEEHNLDVIAVLSDSPISSIASAAGYPICTMPLGILSLNGRPYGLSAIAGANRESKLFQFMHAWETLYPRCTPLTL